MKWDHVEGQWNKVVGQVRTRWAKLTDEDIKRVAGRRALLTTTLQARYGVLKGDAEKQIDGWLMKLRRSDGAYKSAQPENDENP